MPQHFDRDGYAVLPKILADADVARLIEVLQEKAPLTDSAVRSRGSFTYARRNLLQLASVRELAASDAIATIARAILGEDTRPVRGILFDKMPGANWLVPWHQDLSIAVQQRVDVAGFGPWSQKAGVDHVQPPADVLRRMVTIRLHLDDCDDSNGPLRVVPRTHQRVLRPAEISDAVRNGPQLTCPCPAGGVVVMRPLLLHASSPARSPLHRRVIHIEFAADELPGGLRWREC